MGVLYDTYQYTKNKKRCTICGCLMDANHDCYICDVCLDDMREEENKD